MRRKLRLMAVAQDILKNPAFKISSLAEKYKVSEMTIRRDLKYLEDQGVLSHQWDLPKSVPSSGSYVFSKACKDAKEEKGRIAKYAASLIEKNDIIILDTGSTVNLLGSLLPTDIPYTVITYSENLLPYLTLRRNIQLIFIGGYYHHESRSFESTENVEFLSHLRATKMFISTAGVEKNGLTCFSQYEVITKRTAIQSSLKTYLLTDSSKFGITKPAFFSSFEEIDEIITDRGLSPKWRKYLDQLDIQLTLVD